MYMTSHRELLTYFALTEVFISNRLRTYKVGSQLVYCHLKLLIKKCNFE